MKEYYAHTPPDNQPGKWQTMRHHVGEVARLAERFAEPFGAEALAHWAAWLHDVGKYSDEFQKYLRDCNAGIPRKPGSAEHKCAGTKLALEEIAFPKDMKKSIAACVLGHHGGLPCASQETMEDQVYKVEETSAGEAMLKTAIAEARAQCPELAEPPPSVADVPALAAATKSSRLHWEMLTRFVFSCLVDADCLDTEHHFSEDKTKQRELDSLDARLDGWLMGFRIKQQALMSNPQGSPIVHAVRREVYDACLEAAQKPPGLFALTVPTGGGKTRSVLAFALEHAAVHRHTTARRTRIIYAAPYTSIIDQTADVFRELLGADSVLEHHSAVEARQSKVQEGKDGAQAENSHERQRQLLAQNWEVPLVVTTTVQLLESLFSDRTTRCRKLHNLAGSIIILDEVQTLPSPLLLPLLSGLRALLDQFGVTLVLCTATQPAITGDTPFRETLGEPVQIVANPADHFEKLKRVTYRVEKEQWDWTQTAEKIKAKKNNKDKQSSCLAVLNTKKDALALLDALRTVVPEETQLRHLSTLMCGAHRRHVLNEVKLLLSQADANGPAVILVSTQVIEAGVNIDFPHAFRAMGPLDRIIQTAGRCNREGNRQKEDSEVVIFTPLDGTTPSDKYRTAIDSAVNAIQAGGADFDFDTPTVATEYFASLYKSLGEDSLDEEKVQALRLKHDFPEVAKKMRLIKEDTVPVLVPYHQGKFSQAAVTEEEFHALVENIREITAAQQAGRSKGKTLPRDLWRKLQPLTVAVYKTEITKRPASELVSEQLYLWGGTYDFQVGIGRTVDWDTSDLILGSRQ